MSDNCSFSLAAHLLALAAFFSPEFRNRLSGTIEFKPLGFESLVVIVDLELDKLNEMLASKKVKIKLTKKAREYLANEGYDERYGARHIARVIDEKIKELGVSSRVAELLSAKEGDIVYLSDARRWLGGLRSVHAKISAIHDGSAHEAWISLDLIKEGNLIIDRKHRIEKII